jgi:subtilase family serine protease
MNLAMCGSALLFSGSPSGQSTSDDRIVREIDDRSVSIVRGNLSPRAKPEYDQGKAEPSFTLNYITLMFKLSAEQQAGLNALVAQQQDPSSPNYHEWLTPEDYASRFGLSQTDLENIAAWLRGHGFVVVGVARSRSWIAFSGSEQQVEDAFHTEIHRYVVGAQTHYANATEPSVPTALANVVLGFRGLNDFRPKRRSVLRKTKPDFTDSTSGNHYLAPADFATIYNVTGLYNSGVDGAGRKIAVMGQTDIQLSDIDAFRNAAALPANDPTLSLIPGSPDPGTNPNDLIEADLDLEWSGAVAKNATVIYVYSGTANGVFDALTYAIDQDVAPVVSISYGQCEADWGSADLQSLAQQAKQANSQGMSIVAPAGDTGAADCDNNNAPSAPGNTATHGLAVDAPASVPYVTGVGGSQLNEGSGQYWSGSNGSGGRSAISYIPETVWNTTTQDGMLAAGGGGKSAYFVKPSWQKGNGVPNDGARDVPDISLNASSDHAGYLICSQASCVNGFRAADQTLDVVGGTSVGVPTFAGIVALINEKTNLTKGQGNLNPQLYSLAASSGAAFHDITTGNNEVPCLTGSTDCPNGGDIGYSAGLGYDRASGLGSVDAFVLAAEWASSSSGSSPDFELSVSPTSLTVSYGSSGSPTVTVTAANSFTGTVSLSCTVASSLGSTTCSVNPASVVASGTSTLTITAPAKSAGLNLLGRPTSPGWWLMISLASATSFLLSVSRRRRQNLRHGVSAPKWAELRLFLALGLACLLGAGVSCGGSNSSNNGSSADTPSLTGTVTVAGVSGSKSHSASLNVTVN